MVIVDDVEGPEHNTPEYREKLMKWYETAKYKMTPDLSMIDQSLSKGKLTAAELRPAMEGPSVITGQKAMTTLTLPKEQA